MLPLYLLPVALSSISSDALAAPTLPAHWPGAPWGTSPKQPPHPKGCVAADDPEHPWTCDERLGAHTYPVTYTYDGTGLWSGATTCTGLEACNVLREDLERAWGPCVAAPFTPTGDVENCTWIARGRAALWGRRDDDVGGMYFQLFDDAGYREAWESLRHGWWGYRFGDPAPAEDDATCQELARASFMAQDERLFECTSRLLDPNPMFLLYTANRMTRVIVPCAGKNACDALRARVAWAARAPGAVQQDGDVVWRYGKSEITWTYDDDSAGNVSVRAAPAPTKGRP